MFAPSRYTSAPCECNSSVIVTICFSNNPSVFGLVIINTAVSGPTFDLRSSRSTRPFSPLLMVTVSKPASAAEAGLVPCAESGASTLRRWVSPRSRKYAAATNNAVSSPCAPAAGCNDTAGSPEISERYSCIPYSNSSIP